MSILLRKIVAIQLLGCMPKHPLSALFIILPPMTSPVPITGREATMGLKKCLECGAKAAKKTGKAFVKCGKCGAKVASRGK